jgi:hypothetical protein
MNPIRLAVFYPVRKKAPPFMDHFSEVLPFRRGEKIARPD